jgi:hypothetical protein
LATFIHSRDVGATMTHAVSNKGREACRDVQHEFEKNSES